MKLRSIAAVSLITWLLFLPTVIPVPEGYAIIASAYLAVTMVGIGTGIHGVLARNGSQAGLVISSALFLLLYCAHFAYYVTAHLANEPSATALDSLWFVLRTKWRLAEAKMSIGFLGQSMMIAYFELLMPVLQLAVLVILLLTRITREHGETAQPVDAKDNA